MDFYIGQTFNGGYPPEAALWCQKNSASIEEKDGAYEIVQNDKELTLEQAKAAKLNEITMESNVLFHRNTATMTEAELMATYWLKCEADAWLTGTEANVPLLKKTSAASGLPVNDLARVIVANYEKMADYFGTAIGLKLAGELQIQGAQAIGDVEKITFNSSRS